MASQKIIFPQSPIVDIQTGYLSLEWFMWFQNPQFLSIVLGTPIDVINGGTGLSSGTSGGILGFVGSTTMASSVALTNHALVVGGGAGATPTPLASLGTTTTVLHGNATGNPTFGAVSLTADVSGTLPIANGGTGIASYAVGDIIYASGSTTLSKLADVATGNALISGGVTTAPSWGKIGLTTHVSGVLPGDNGGTGVANTGKTITLGGNLTTSGAFASTFTMTGATNVTFPTSGTLSTTTGTVTSVASNFTGGLISVGGSPITTSGTLAMTVAGTSGGIPYFSGATTWASSGALAASAIVLGGGAGNPPATTTTGTGVVTALGVNVGTAGSFVVNGGALGSPSSAGTMPSFTLGGTIAGGGQTVNNLGIVGIGGSANAAIGLLLLNSGLSGTQQVGVEAAIKGTSAATVNIFGFVGNATTAAVSFTCADLAQFFAADPTKGAGSTISNSHGFLIADLTQGTNNYAITCQVSSGTNKKNLNITGTADNYIKGNLQVDGILTLPVNQPMFLATATAGTDVTGDSTVYTIVWGTEIYDQGGNLSGTTFTAPVTGKYRFNVTVRADGLTSSNTLYLVSLVASNRTIILIGENPGQTQFGGTLIRSASTDVDMDAADTVTITFRADGTTKVVDVATGSTFSGSLIG